MFGQDEVALDFARVDSGSIWVKEVGYALLRWKGG